MKYFTSLAAGIAAAILAAAVYALFSSGVSYTELGWGGYLAVDLAAAPSLIILLITAFAVGFFGMLRRASR